VCLGENCDRIQPISVHVETCRLSVPASVLQNAKNCSQNSACHCSYELTSDWMTGWVDGRMDVWMDEWVDGWMGGWVGGWMNGWVNRWMDG
jgi:hypothetical protein